MEKKIARQRRGKKTKMHIREQRKIALRVHRTPRHIYAQVIDAEGDKILVAASTVEKAIAEKVKYTGNVAAAEVVGTLIGERAAEKGISEVAFDRGGFAYHGRVKALADAARKKLKF